MSGILAVMDHSAAGWMVALALATICLALYMLQPKHRYKLPPGPPASPLWGHLSDFQASDFEQRCLKYAGQYSEGIFTLWLLGKPVCVVTNPELYRSLISRSSTLSKPEGVYGAFNCLGCPDGKVTNIFTEPGTSPYWKSVRKGLSPCFSTENIRKVFPVTIKNCIRLGDMWEAMDGLVSGAQSIDIEPYIKCTIFDVLGSTGYGMDWGALDAVGKPHAFMDSLHDCLIETTRACLDPFRTPLRKALFFLPQNQKIEQSFKTMFKFYLEILNFLMQKEFAEEDETIGARIIQLKDLETGEPMTDDQILANISILTIAGFDTSSYTVIWALYDIARLPEVQQRIKEELQEHGLLHVPGSAPARALDWTDLAKLPYFNAVFKESMRYHHISGGTARVTPSDGPTQVGPYVLPPKTTLHLPSISIMRSPHNWCKADVFMPERWMEADGDSPENQSGPRLTNKDAYMPFMEGHRSCIGQNMAMMSTRTVLLSILSRFWLVVDEAKMGTPEEVDAKAHFALVQVPANGTHLYIQRHT